MWSELNALAEWIMVGIYIVVAVFAYKQISDARYARIAQTRPYVYIDFDLENAPMIYLTLQNVGATAAKDVSFTCDPPITSTISGTSANVLNKQWPFLPPNKSIRYLFDSSIQRFASGSTLPVTFTVKATYHGTTRAMFQAKDVQTPYEETFVLDLESYRNLMYTRPTTLEEVVKPLQDIVKELKSSDGIRVLSRDYRDWMREQEERRAEWDEHFRAVKQQPENQPTQPDNQTAPDQGAPALPPDTDDPVAKG